MPFKEMGWVGLEPTTNAETFRGCSTIELLVRSMLE
jgi:hypothetical protein